MPEKNYTAWWKKIDSLVKEQGLFESGLKEVKQLYAKAAADKQTGHQLKALLYQLQLQEVLVEESDTLALHLLQQEIKRETGLTRAMLFTLLADYYRNQYQQVRWQLYNRTPLADAGSNNIKSWTAPDFHKAITAAYLEALKEPSIKKEGARTVYEPLIIKGDKAGYRASLYELVLQKALSYFKEDPVELPRNADQRFFTDKALWKPAEVFVALPLNSSDSTDPGVITLELYQQLFRYYISRNEKEQLATADLDRYQLLKSKSASASTDSLYLTVLESFPKKYPGTAAADEAVYLLANWYVENENPVKAVEILSRISSTKKTDGSKKAFNLLQEIKAPALYLQTEQVNLPGEAFRASLEWKNLEKIYLKIIKTDSKKHAQLLDQAGYFDSTNWSNLLKDPVLRSWEQSLPANSDYKSHRAEIKVDALPAGSYFLLVSDRPGFSMDDANLGIVDVQVSNISYIQSGQDYFVLHRNSGKPLANARVELFQRKYDYQSRKYSRTKVDEVQTNEKGFVYIGSLANNNQGSFMLTIHHGDESLRINEQNYIYSYHQNRDTVREDYEKRNAKLYYFTDRSIYRPGQILHFKGLLTSKQRENQEPYILTDKKTTVYLYNANGEKIDSLQLTTNAFGSFAGRFTLPASGLTGQFYLRDETYHSSTYFSVEEYKRPRFEVKLENLKTIVRLGDTVTIEGKALAYAGNAISNAEGSYRVIRRARFFYPWKMVDYGYRPRGESAEISYGSFTTAADGSFKVSFASIPDDRIDPSTDPVFDYELQVDITDLNGETRSASSTTPVAYKALQLSIGAVRPQLAATDFTQLRVLATNILGEPQPTEVQVQILPLKHPGRLMRARYWEAPDQFVYTEKEFISYFPNDLYKQEDDPANWPAGATVWNKKIRTDSTGVILLDKKKWAPGYYQLVAWAIDGAGDTVENKSIVYLTDPSGKNLEEAGYFSSTQTVTELKPGASTKITLTTAARSLFVIEKRVNWKTASMETPLPFGEKFRLFELDREQIEVPVMASAADKGGIEIQHVFVKNNRIYTSSGYFVVPLDEKELKIKLETFRDKLEPGKQEKWTVSITGAEAEKFGMELLTSMYDASLDQFRPHNWQQPGIWPVLGRQDQWTGRTNFVQAGSSNHRPLLPNLAIDWVEPDKLIGFENLERRQIRIRGAANMVIREEGMASAAPTAQREKQEGEMDQTGYLPPIIIPQSDSAQTLTPEEPAPPAIRTNFNETAFFFPQLSADSNGQFSFSFLMPESVTTWKWQLFAHTKSLAMGYLQQSIVTQKDLMVQPNMPRFLREGDQLEITTKVVNLTDQEFTGQAELQLIDATNNQPVDGWFRNFFPNQYFTVAAKSSELVKFPVQVPYLFDRALTWKIIARVGDKTDGESATLPVLSNRQLVTEAVPFFINGAASKTIPLTHLLESKDSETLSNQSLTVEFSSNPAWYAIQSLPYLTDYPYECAEQSFNRLYGYLIADHLLKSAPRIRTILEQWQGKDTSALLSNLQKNEALKQVLLEETPWVLEAKSEAEQKKRLLLLFDASKLKLQSAKMISQLKEMQSENGGFSWFKGGPDDRYITQYILTGIGHLQQLGIINANFGIFAPIVKPALSYADLRLLEDYKKRDKGQKNPTTLNYSSVQYHYMRSFFTRIGISGEYMEAANHYRKEIQQHWIKGNLMAKAMIALALHRTGDKKTAENILKSLQQTAIKSPDKGMYWKANTSGYYWQEAPIETQALLIELFQELKQPSATVNELKAWLLLNKQTNRWSSTKATADACYALLLQGSNWLEAAPKVAVSLGTVTIIRATKEEAGTGYYQKTIPGTAVFPEMGTIKIQVEQAAAPVTSAPVWGAVYWQYFDNLENIKAAKGPLSISKQVMLEEKTENGPVLKTIQDGNALKVGDKITVRLEISTDRQMEYVHLKDMRASSLEPVNVLSGYRWKGALGYYESTRDASTNFFIQYLPKGTHILEYSLFVTHSGTFSNGISSIQCMYAPEFTSHTNGIQLNIEAN